MGGGGEVREREREGGRVESGGESDGVLLLYVLSY